MGISCHCLCFAVLRCMNFHGPGLLLTSRQAGTGWVGGDTANISQSRPPHSLAVWELFGWIEYYHQRNELGTWPHIKAKTSIKVLHVSMLPQQRWENQWCVCAQAGMSFLPS